MALFDVRGVLRRESGVFGGIGRIELGGGMDGTKWGLVDGYMHGWGHSFGRADAWSQWAIFRSLLYSTRLIDA